MDLKKLLSMAVLSLVAVPAVAVAIRGQEQEPPLEPRILAYDKGPAKIDVSKYPPDMRARYKVFTTKCGKCHTLARAVNCEFALEDEWERYVKRMMRKAGSFISPDEGKQIYEFVVFDSKTRKKDLYERKLKDASRTAGP